MWASGSRCDSPSCPTEGRGAFSPHIVDTVDRKGKSHFPKAQNVQTPLRLRAPGCPENSQSGNREISGVLLA